MPTKTQYPEEEVLVEETKPDAIAPHPRGIRRALILFGALAVAGAATYATPELAELRPWSPDSRVPFSTIVDFRPPTRPRLAGVQERRSRRPKSADELLATAPLPEAATSAPETPAEAPGVDASLRIPPAAYAGMTRPIEDPSGAMGHWYARLFALARGDEVLGRMLLYSDSINGSDRTSRALRQMLGERFGHGGKGFVPISPGWQYQRHKNVEWEHSGFRVFVVNRGEVEDGRYGLGGVLAVNRGPRARARFATVDDAVGSAVSTYRLFYQAHPDGGDIALSVDGGDATILPTSAERIEDRVHAIELPDGPHALDLRVHRGEARLYGVVMEADAPGVVVDGLMLVGAFTRVLQNFDAEHWARQISLREPDLIAFWLGGNDATSKAVGFVEDAYVQDYATVLRTARAGRPDASCLVVSVLDAAERVDGEVRSRNRVPRVVAAQREAAFAAGCAFFDGYEAIGGRGTMRRWARSSPRLVSVDFRHLSGEGATVFATLLERAMLKGYDDWLVAQSATGETSE